MKNTVNLFEKEKKLTLRERATRQLRQVIVSGKLKPGERLIEQDISEMMGISRLPIREALSILEKEGLVTVEPYKGAFVSCFSQEEIDELYSIRELLELHALQLAMQKDLTSLVSELRTVTQKMTEVYEKAGCDFHIFDFSFHETICKKSGNRTLFNLWSELAVRIQTYLNVEAQQDRQQNAMGKMIHSHNELCSIIASGNQEDAARKLREHLAVGKSKLHSYTGKRALDRDQVNLEMD